MQSSCFSWLQLVCLVSDQSWESPPATQQHISSMFYQRQSCWTLSTILQQNICNVFALCPGSAGDTPPSSSNIIIVNVGSVQWNMFQVFQNFLETFSQLMRDGSWSVFSTSEKFQADTVRSLKPTILILIAATLLWLAKLTLLMTEVY